MHTHTSDQYFVLGVVWINLYHVVVSIKTS
jgi:hypothetical protein